MLNLIISIVLAYLIGSVPTSFIFGKLLKGIDIREHGSGNVGATNVFRVIGKVPAFAVLFIDILKGTIAVIVIPQIFLNNFIGVNLGLEIYKIILGIFAISGHVWSVFLNFKGGKGVATTAGVMIALSPAIVAGSVVIWIIIFSMFRIVSVASIIASIFLPIFGIIFQKSFTLIIFTVVLCIVGTYKHKENIKRLIRGEEKRIV